MTRVAKRKGNQNPSGMGMVGGAAAGAAAGSFIGPLGAAVGAVVGGAVGSQTHAEDVKAAVKKVKVVATSKPAKNSLKAVARNIAKIPSAAKSLVHRDKKDNKGSKTAAARTKSAAKKPTKRRSPKSKAAKASRKK